MKHAWNEERRQGRVTRRRLRENQEEYGEAEGPVRIGVQLGKNGAPARVYQIMGAGNGIIYAEIHPRCVVMLDDRGRPTDEPSRVPDDYEPGSLE